MLPSQAFLALGRHAIRSTIRQSSRHVVPRKRTFTSTQRVRQASESPNVRDSTLFRQLATNPEALIAIKEFTESLKVQGLDFTKDAPSQFQIFKLLANSEFRKTLEKLKVDLEKAGVEITPDNAMEMLHAFKGVKGKDQ
ncbi:hypothetical protein M422DRAFT_22791 [Sphaerobolus stellatus SS14]|nr:hypothetical protein M422DRAFT_22791 [Sphaerobolus stellatus SS14]